MLTHDEFRRQAGLIPYQYRHPEFLYGLVRWLRPSVVVEVGTHLGMSAVWMARGLQENGAGRLFCIDSFCWREEPNQERDWNRNIDACGVRDVVTLLKGRSQEVQWPERVDLAYIDGNHSSEVCVADCIHAAANGAQCLCLNDTSTCEGVQNIAEEICTQWTAWTGIEVPFDAGLLVAMRWIERPAPTQGDFDHWDKP